MDLRQRVASEGGKHETVTVTCSWWYYPEIQFDVVSYSNSFVETQAGSVGSTVSNGIYGYGTISSFTEFFDDCNAWESSVTEISYHLSLLDSVDFHHNAAYGDGFGPGLIVHFDW